ncbi:MAG TPA: nucleotidyltransferase family protein [Ktedonobacterales bacterium]
MTKVAMATSSASQTQPQIAGVLLAAGRSSRMDAHKLLLPLAGKPLIAHSLSAACASHARPILLMLGRSATQVEAALEPGSYSVVVNPRYTEGMGTTLALAISSLPVEVIGAIILLGDQPLMTTAAIDTVLSAARQHPEHIIMGQYANHTSHPVYLPRRVFGQVTTLTGDAGARSIIAAERQALITVPIADEFAAFDVDTLEDYARAQALLQSAQLSENNPR